MNLKSLRTDPKKESEGQWVQIDEESSIKVRSTDTSAYRRASIKKFEPFRRGMRINRNLNEVVPESTQEKIGVDLIVDEVLVDWKGIKDGDKEVPYSKEKARELLQIKAFRDMVEQAAADLTNFRIEDAGEDAGNSAPTSAGS